MSKIPGIEKATEMKVKKLRKEFEGKFPMASPDYFTFEQSKQCVLVLINDRLKDLKEDLKEVKEHNPSPQLVVWLSGSIEYWKEVKKSANKLKYE